jgi:hypothetical protein
MAKVNSLIIGLMLMGLSQPLLAQEHILKTYAEDHHSSSYCLYPSTLRMINLSKDEAFDEIASSFQKFLIYELDSLSVVDQSFKRMLTNYQEEGFEEYLTILGSSNYTVILGKEKRINEMVGIFGLEDQMFAFFLQGNIALQKIPTLINTLSENDLFNVLNIRPGEWE